MKKLYPLIIAAVMLSFTSQAQYQILGGDMENWTEIKFPPSFFSSDTVLLQTPFGFQDPLGMISALFGSQPSTHRTADAYAGDSALLIKGEPDGGGGLLFQTTACGFRPTTFHAALKFTGAKAVDDTITVGIVFSQSFKRTSTGNTVTLDTVGAVGFAIYEVSGNIPTYQAIDIPITYLNNNIPDSAAVVIYSANNGPNDTTYAYFDDLSVSYATTGFSELEDLLQISPNPAHESFSINNASLKGADLTVFDGRGSSIMATKNEGQPINVSHLQRGYYILEVVKNDLKIHQKLIID